MAVAVHSLGHMAAVCLCSGALSVRVGSRPSACPGRRGCTPAWAAWAAPAHATHPAAGGLPPPRAAHGAVVGIPAPSASGCSRRPGRRHAPPGARAHDSHGRREDNPHPARARRAGGTVAAAAAVPPRAVPRAARSTSGVSTLLFAVRIQSHAGPRQGGNRCPSLMLVGSQAALPPLAPCWLCRASLSRWECQDAWSRIQA